MNEITLFAVEKYFEDNQETGALLKFLSFNIVAIVTHRFEAKFVTNQFINVQKATTFKQSRLNLLHSVRVWLFVLNKQNCLKSLSPSSIVSHWNISTLTSLNGGWRKIKIDSKKRAEKSLRSRLSSFESTHAFITCRSYLKVWGFKIMKSLCFTIILILLVRHRLESSFFVRVLFSNVFELWNLIFVLQFSFRATHLMLRFHLTPANGVRQGSLVFVKSCQDKHIVWQKAMGIHFRRTNHHVCNHRLLCSNRVDTVSTADRLIIN